MIESLDDRYWDRTESPKTTKSPKMRELKEEEVDVVDIEITADGNTERKLKKTKAPAANVEFLETTVVVRFRWHFLQKC